MYPKALLERACRLDYDQYNSSLSSDAKLCNVQQKDFTRNDIDCAYRLVMDRLENVAFTSFPVKRSRHFSKQYCFDELDVLHKSMTQILDIWCEAGKSRGHTFGEYRNYKTKKSVFRAGHRRCVDAFIFGIDLDLQDAARFCKLIIARKGKNTCSIGSGINFDGIVYRSREDRCEQ